jgi:biopolymer transport protein ExbB/TolQ
MKQHQPPIELLYQIVSLLIAFILVHGFYVTVVRPQAESFLQQEQLLMEQDDSHVRQRNFFVVIKDFEQEACLILMLWAGAILAYKGESVRRQRRLLNNDLLQLPPALPIGLEDTAQLQARITETAGGKGHYLLPRALTTAIHRFAATGDVQDSAAAVGEICQAEGERLDAELSIIRYVAWAIPSIGFIGTVRGISAALGEAHLALKGDITSVVQYLGVAFNSTFIALIISIILMFFVHQLQLAQERLVLDTRQYCNLNFISRLRKPIHQQPT